AKRPALVSRRLQSTRQGCDWLLDRWAALGAVLARDGAWTEAQQALVLDLLGTPPELRDGPSAEPAGPLVAREVMRLERLRAEALDELDEHEQAAAELGLEIRPSRSLTLLRRYEAECMRRFQWARARLRD